MKTTKNTDFTLREPQLPKLQKAWHKMRLQEDLDAINGKYGNWSCDRTPAEVKKFWASVNRPWVKVVLKCDIKIKGKVFARKGDTVWAEFHKGNPNQRFGLMVSRSASPAQIAKYRKYLAQDHYIVRIPALRKLASRPSWDGELFHTNIRVEVKEVKVVK